MTSILLRRVFPLIILSFAATSQSQEWHSVTSKSGKVTVSIPGPAEESVVKKKTLAGEILTYVKRHRTDSTIFDLSFTPVKKGVVRFIGKKKLFDNAKGGVLTGTMGREKTWEPITVDGVECMLMTYEIANPADGSTVAYDGFALMVVLDDGLYVANAIVKKEKGMAEIRKFKDSVRIKN